MNMQGKKKKNSYIYELDIYWKNTYNIF
ncbi:hypothetical protein, partial [Plasmodium yoelii yoelii]